MFILCRYPSTQEDEGRIEYLGQYNTREKAEERITEMCSSGYYTRRQFFTMESHEADS